MLNFQDQFVLEGSRRLDLYDDQRRWNAPQNCASRHIVDWSLRESLREPKVELLFQRAKQKFPQTCSHIFGENGRQFILEDFKDLIRGSESGITAPRESMLDRAAS